MLDAPEALAAFAHAQDASGLVAVSHAEYAALERMMDAALEPR